MNPNKTRDFTPPFSQDLAGTTPFTKKPRRPSLGDQGPWRPAPPVSLPPQVEPGTSQRVSRWNSWNLWNLSVYPLAEPPGNPSESPIVSAHEDLFLRNQCWRRQKLRDFSWEKFGMPFWPECRVNMEELFFVVNNQRKKNENVQMSARLKLQAVVSSPLEILQLSVYHLINWKSHSYNHSKSCAKDRPFNQTETSQDVFQNPTIRWGW